MPELGPRDLDRRSTAEMVANSLRERLFASEYPPGTPMRESGLAPLLGVSRATMREGLQRLAHEGLLTYHMHRGMVVTEVSSADVRDIYTVRQVMELAAISAAARHLPELTELEASVDAHAAAAEKEDVTAIVEADMRFHQELVHLSGSPRLSDYQSMALGQLRLALNLLDRSTGDLQIQVREHRQIYDCLIRREIDRAAELLTAHLQCARSSLIKFLEQSGKSQARPPG
jgi:DNA-binding GntR family transcriptional regulator